MTSRSLTWDDTIKKQKIDEELPKVLKKLDASKTCTSLIATREKIVATDINYDLISEVYCLEFSINKLFVMRMV